MISGNISQAQNLKQFKWENRILLVFSDKKENEIYKEQLQELSENEEGLAERKLLLFEVVEEEYRKTHFDNANAGSSKWLITENLRKKFNAENERFKVVLIGLDGRVKRTTNKLFEKEALFGLIDSMPMRIQEMSRGE